jgi:nitrogen fixation NifU-like protein
MPADALPPPLREHFEAPQHVGEPPGAQRRGEARNEACGDVVVVWLRLAGAETLIEAAGFKAQGCPASLAVASAACELLPGLAADGSLQERLAGRFEARFGRPRPAHRHALALVAEAARRAAGG